MRRQRDHVGHLVVRGAGIHVVDVALAENDEVTAFLGILGSRSHRHELLGDTSRFCGVASAVATVVTVSTRAGAEGQRECRADRHQEPELLGSHS